ncbi:MAG: hypothetical protein J0H73_07675 [Salana multivorans]|uniref:hypothetical protein n=1 Tax=Salana multivorans TaxID=120377 RepID=UPI0009600346|nr:hypothetical protein [Salana multivorans]MBN8882177.1 hypothetical protein [Salana multivorans]OJX97366.1 MAG: hypothetical protein BGO96_05390 [Micrococcales bacterium 73-15]
MSTKPPRYLLADRILLEKQGKSLKEWVFEHRLRLTPVAWGALAKKLARDTDGVVAVTQLTLRSWFADEISAARAEADADEADDSEGEPPALAAVS